MKSGKEEQRSPFATALARLLDDTNLLTRQQWAELLDVSPAAISQWVNDKTIPRPEVLRMVIDALEEKSALTSQALEPSCGQVGKLPHPEQRLPLPERILAEFKKLTRRPSIEVSPNGERMGRSIGHYVVKPLLEGFLRNLDALDFETQERILYQASAACRQTQGSAERGVPNAELEGLHNDPDRLSIGADDPASVSAALYGLRGDGWRGGAPVAVEMPAEAALSTDGTAPDDDAEDEDIVTKTLVVNGEKQARLIRLIDRYQGLRLAAQNGEPTAPGGPKFEVVGKFYLDNEDSLSVVEGGQGVASCVVVLWSFRSGENLFDPFPLDEMMFYPLRGDFEWQYEGDVGPVRLSVNPQYSDLMWMTAGKYRGPDRGLPPCRVLAGPSSIGLAVFYSKHGVELLRTEGRGDLKDARVEFETVKWSEATIREFWASIRSGDSHLANRLPFVARVPATLHQLSAFVEENKIPVNPDRKVKHDPARSRGQLSDARLRLWDDWKDAVLFPRIVKFHAWPPDKEGEICMDHHTGREIIVPLGGAFKCLYANLEPEDTELYELRSADLRDRIKRRYVRSAEVSGQDYSDILLLCSNSAHGFTGIEGEDSYCLHIACRAYPHGMQQPRRRKSESGDLRERRMA